MGIFDYKQSIALGKNDPTFDALLFAAMRKADSFNLNRLEQAFPEQTLELRQRYNAPGGRLRETNEEFDAASRAADDWMERTYK